MISRYFILVVILAFTPSVMGCATKIVMTEAPSDAYIAGKLKIGDCIKVDRQNGESVIGILKALPETRAEVRSIEISTLLVPPSFDVRYGTSTIKYERTRQIPLTDITRIKGYPKVFYELRKASFACLGCCLYSFFLGCIFVGAGGNG